MRPAFFTYLFRITVLPVVCLARRSFSEGGHGRFRKKLFHITILMGSCIGILPLAAQGQEKGYPDFAGQEIRTVPDSVVSGLQKQKEFSYANDPAFWASRPPRQEENQALARMIQWLADSAFLPWLLYFLLALLVFFVLYQVVVANNFFMVRRNRIRKKTDAQDIEEEIPDDIDARIDRAVAAGEFRTAVRFLYLKTLQWLHDKQQIRLQARATNHDYIQQMQSHPQAAGFRHLTRMYEYVWYGAFLPNEQQFRVIHDKFNQFLQSS